MIVMSSLSVMLVIINNFISCSKIINKDMGSVYISEILKAFSPCIAFHGTDFLKFEPYIKFVMRNGLPVTTGKTELCPNKCLFIKDLPTLVPYKWAKLLLILKPGDKLPETRKFGSREVIVIRNRTLLQLSFNRLNERKFMRYPSNSLKLNNLGQLNLNGQTLKVAMYKCPVMGIILRNEHDDHVRFDGLEIRILNEIAAKLNFTWKIHRLDNSRLWGSFQKNGSWVGGVIGALANNEANIALCSIWVSVVQQQLIDITANYHKMSASFLVPRNISNMKLQNIVVPVEPEVWYFLAVSLFVAFFMYYLSSHFTNAPLTITESCLEILKHVLACASKVTGNSSTQLILKNTIAISILVLTSNYSSFVISKLTTTTKPLELNTIEQLARNNISWGRRMLSVNPSLIFNTENYWQNIFSQNYQKVNRSSEYEKFLKRQKLAIYVEYFDHLYVNMDVKLNVENLKKMRLMREVVSEHYTGIGFSKFSPLTEHASRIINNLKSGGVIKKMYRDVVRLYGNKEVIKMLSRAKKKALSKWKPLRMNHLERLFFITTLYWGISFLVLLAEILIKVKTKKIINK